MALFEKITDDEIDQIVSYLQAVVDLSYSPLFAEGQPWPRSEVVIERDGSEHQIFHVPDPYVFRSALIPFRRIWLQKEPSNFGRVCNTLIRRYPEGARWYFQFLRDHFQRSKESDMAWKLSRAGGRRDTNEKPLLAGEAIEQGLYLDLFHCDSKRSTTKKTAGAPSNCESARFEYVFIASIYDVAIKATVLQEAAQFCLDELRLQSRLNDSRLIRALLPGDERFPDGTMVRRYSPGYTPQPQSYGEKLFRLRRENAFLAMNAFLSVISVSDNIVADAILASTNLPSFLAFLGLEWSDSQPKLDESDVVGDSGQESEGDLNHGVCGTIRKGSQIWCNDAESIEEQLKSAKSMLRNREDWNSNARQLWKVAMRNISLPFPVQKLNSNSL